MSIIYEIAEGRMHKLSKGLRCREYELKIKLKRLYYKAKFGIVSPFLHYLTSEHPDLVSQNPIIKIT